MKSGSRGDRSCKRVRLPNVVEVDGAEVRGRLPLPPEHDDFSLAHATRAALMNCSGNKNMSAGLTATRQAQMTVTFASITDQRMLSTVCPGEQSSSPLAIEVSKLRFNIAQREEVFTVSDAGDDAGPYSGEPISQITGLQNSQATGEEQRAE